MNGSLKISRPDLLSPLLIWVPGKFHYARSVAITSCLGELSAGNLYHCVGGGGGGVGEEEGQKKGVHRIEPGSTDTSGYRPLHLQAYNSDGP